MLKFEKKIRRQKVNHESVRLGQLGYYPSTCIISSGSSGSSGSSSSSSSSSSGNSNRSRSTALPLWLLAIRDAVKRDSLGQGCTKYYVAICISSEGSIQITY